MRQVLPILLCLGGLLLAILGYRGARDLARQIQVERAAAAKLQSRIAWLRQRREASLSDLAQAEKELRSLQSLAPGDVDQSRKSEIQSWLERVKRLQRLFADRPDERIPELDLLTDDDWLRIARWASLDDPAAKRKAMGDARNAAKRLLMPMLGNALRAYAAAHQNTLPAQATDLAPYLADSRAASALSRYQMLAAAAVPPNRPSTGPAITEAAPVDADADSKITITNNGSGAIALPPAAWIPGFTDLRKAAYRAYSQANQGAVAPSAADVIPYFNPPLDSATQQKFLQSAENAIQEF